MTDNNTVVRMALCSVCSSDDEKIEWQTVKMFSFLLLTFILANSYCGFHLLTWQFHLSVIVDDLHFLIISPIFQT